MWKQSNRLMIFWLLCVGAQWHEHHSLWMSLVLIIAHYIQPTPKKSESPKIRGKSRRSRGNTVITRDFVNVSHLRRPSLFISSLMSLLYSLNVMKLNQIHRNCLFGNACRCKQVRAKLAEIWIRIVHSSFLFYFFLLWKHKQDQLMASFCCLVDFAELFEGAVWLFVCMCQPFFFLVRGSNSPTPCSIALLPNWCLITSILFYLFSLIIIGSIL